MTPEPWIQLQEVLRHKWSRIRWRSRLSHPASGQQEVFQKKAHRLTFHLLPSRPQRPLLLTFYFQGITDDYTRTPPPPPVLLPLSSTWLSVDEEKPQNVSSQTRKVSASSFVRMIIFWDAREESVPVSALLKIRTPSRLLSGRSLTVVDVLVSVFRGKCKICLEFICSTFYLLSMLVKHFFFCPNLQKCYVATVEKWGNSEVEKLANWILHKKEKQFSIILSLRE